MKAQGQSFNAQLVRENAFTSPLCGITKVIFILSYFYSDIFTVTQSCFTIAVNFWFDMSFDVRWIFHMSIRTLLGLDEREAIKDEKEKEKDEEK